MSATNRCIDGISFGNIFCEPYIRQRLQFSVIYVLINGVTSTFSQKKEKYTQIYCPEILPSQKSLKKKEKQIVRITFFPQKYRGDSISNLNWQVFIERSTGIKFYAKHKCI